VEQRLNREIKSAMDGVAKAMKIAFDERPIK
jgi:hypothetical protein